jgi:signal transduction histidine kinase/CheY-like chemotaxis protein
MNPEHADSQSVRRSISRFRKLTLASVVVIMIINIFMVHRITSVLDHGSATKINDSGRMGLISQRIQSIAYEIHVAIETSNWEDLERLHEQLIEVRASFQTKYDSLYGNRAPEEFFPNATVEERDQVSSIVLPYNRITTAAQELDKLTLNSIRTAPYVNNLNKSRIKASVEEIRDAQSLFLPRMSTIVSLYEQRSSMEITESTRQARIGLVMLAVLLAAMVLFIIEPTILIVRRQLRELDLANRRERKAVSVRWRLLTNMGHEFRTPMNAILGFAELLNDDSLTEPERERLSGSIHDSARHLEKLIETMLDMSAMESGQLRVNNTCSRLRDVLTPCIERAQTETIASGLELRLQLDPSCDIEINTEPKRLSQVVEKLIDNAIKFTAEGHIEIRARVESTQDHHESIIEIADTGIGIEPDQFELIFDAFHQAQNNLTREFGGSGLGLSFARDLADALGGTIGVESTPSKGSTFTIRLRTPKRSNQSTRTANTQADTKKAAIFSNRRMLVVDDAKDNRVLLQHFLKRTGARIDFAYDGQQAVQRVNTSIQESDPYEIVLMDMQMPVLDGYNATMQLRESGFNAPIIAITAHALDGDREHCINAGCDEYLSKPVNRNALIQMCHALLTPSESDETTQDPPSAAA